MIVEFKIGGKYQNQKGVFEVLAKLPNNKIEVRYQEGGEVVRLDISFAKEKAIPFDPSVLAYVPTQEGIDYYSTLGFICSHAQIQVYMGHGHKDRFISRYEQATGKQPNEQGKCFYAHPEGVKKGGIEIEIAFDESLCSFVKFKNVNITKRTQGFASINNNELGYHLFSLGFELGKEHNKEQILLNVPLQYQEYFIEGFNQ